MTTRPGLTIDAHDWSLSELLSLVQAANYLRGEHRPRSVQSLYDRIRRGTIYAVRIGREWYIPRTEVKRLARQPYHRSGGRPRLRASQAISSHFVFDKPDDTTILRLAQLSVAKRGHAQLEAQAFLRGTIRARLRRVYPHLTPRELTFKMFAELDGHA